MARIYLDNGATSWPKAPGVAEAMANYITDVGVSVGRGAYTEAHDAERVLLTTREQINELFNGPDPSNVIFTMNVTQSLNMLLKGLLKPNDEIIISPLEHNAVMRPLEQLKAEGVVVKVLSCDSEGFINLRDLDFLMNEKTKAVVICHGSNVFGTVQSLEEIGSKIRSLKPETYFIADCAQTAGILPIDMEAAHLDAVAFTGHKSLLGPQGTGGFVLTNRLNAALVPMITGGTGSHSESEIQPEYLPDKFESGTPNTVGLYGLNAALNYILSHDRAVAYEKEMLLTEAFIKGIETLQIGAIRVCGPSMEQKRTAVVSLDFHGFDNAEVSYYLQKEFDIATRVGMHCAPAAHRSMGTYPQGTVRFSFSEFNTLEEVKKVLSAIPVILEGLK